MYPVRDIVMYYVYVLQSNINKKFYTGCTKDLRKRFTLHNEGRVKSSCKGRPWKLVYYEACVEQVDAYAREKYLKSGMGKRFIKNRVKHFLSLTG